MNYESGDLPSAGTGTRACIPDHEELIVPSAFGRFDRGHLQDGLFSVAPPCLPALLM